MAIDPAPKTELEQKQPDDLVTNTDISPSEPSYVVPSTGTLDPSAIEMIVNLDLDEMLLYFHGRHVTHDIEPKSSPKRSWCRT